MQRRAFDAFLCPDQQKHSSTTRNDDVIHFRGPECKGLSHTVTEGVICQLVKLLEAAHRLLGKEICFAQTVDHIPEGSGGFVI